MMREMGIEIYLVNSSFRLGPRSVSWLESFGQRLLIKGIIGVGQAWKP